MSSPRNVFENFSGKPETRDGVFSEDEVRLANRNSGILLETLKQDITPTGAHYLLIHFDVPLLDESVHQLEFGQGFDNPHSLSLDDIRALPQQTMAVTLECAGNGRANMSPRTYSQPWSVEAVGTSLWTGTALAPLIEQANPQPGTVNLVFTGADRGFDKGHEHTYQRSLTLDQLASLDVLLVHAMNGQPLLPQHGAPLRIVVPGWYGMASVKWLSHIEASDTPFEGYQQTGTYHYRKHDNDPGTPVTSIRVKSLMVPPGVPDWTTRFRHLTPGPVAIVGRAWSGNGAAVDKVEFSSGDGWQVAELSRTNEKYAWTKWSVIWDAKPGEYVLRCRATDVNGNIQPLEPRWDNSGFGNNAAQSVHVYVAGR
ncbi:MAG: molybdopterin-dependent oxidoreductase [Granulosicoccus sp.]